MEGLRLFSTKRELRSLVFSFTYAVGDVHSLMNLPPITASPPRFLSVEELMETAKGVTNMALAHEIVVNQGFQVKPSELPEGR